jgi:nitrite reductase (cytochrome c-552)
MKAGVDVAIKVDLEMMKYVTDRGQRKLEFDPSLELKDPMGIQDRFF